MFKYLFIVLFLPFVSKAQKAGSETHRLYNIIIEKGDTEDEFDISYEVYLKKKHRKDEYYSTVALDTFLALLTTDLQNQPLDKNDLLLYIHGMWGGTNHMFNQASRLMHEAYVDHSDATVARILSVKWPGNTSQYQTNKSAAFALAPRLKRIFNQLIRSVQIIDYLDYKKDYRINVMAHSLGNELIKELFHYWDPSDLDQCYFDELILAAPDLDDDLFEEGNLLTSMHKIANRVHIYFSRKDLTLNVSKAINKRNRMGVSGPSKESVIANNVYFIDVSEIKDEHNLRDRITGHSYYRISDTATSDMRETISGSSVPEIPKRELIDERLNIYKLNPASDTP